MTNPTSSIEHQASRIKLRKIAHARSGDKGSSANIAVFANTREGFEFLRDRLTAARVEEYFKPLGVGKVGKDKTQRILVLKGTGPIFCAGLDLEEASQAGKVDASARMVAKTILTLHNCPLVTFAIVHGAALAGGAGLMSACDFVFAEE